MNTENGLILNQAWAILAEVVDPEIPVLSLQDLGIIRKVELCDDVLNVTITPTYSGCPAREVISDSVFDALNSAGFSVKVIEQLSPAWTTDWMSDTGKLKLKAYGIAPPRCTQKTPAQLGQAQQITMMPYKPECPQCESHNTQLLSAFGSTACKALYRCNDCLEPFDYFKPI